MFKFTDEILARLQRRKPTFTNPGVESPPRKFYLLKDNILIKDVGRHVSQLDAEWLEKYNELCDELPLIPVYDVHDHQLIAMELISNPFSTFEDVILYESDELKDFVEKKYNEIIQKIFKLNVFHGDALLKNFIMEKDSKKIYILDPESIYFGDDFKTRMTYNELMYKEILRSHDFIHRVRNLNIRTYNDSY